MPANLHRHDLQTRAGFSLKFIDIAFIIALLIGVVMSPDRCRLWSVSAMWGAERIPKIAWFRLPKAKKARGNIWESRIRQPEQHPLRGGTNGGTVLINFANSLEFMRLGEFF